MKDYEAPCELVRAALSFGPNEEGRASPSYLWPRWLKSTLWEQKRTSGGSLVNRKGRLWLFISRATKRIIFVAFVEGMPLCGPPCWDFEEL